MADINNMARGKGKMGRREEREEKEKREERQNLLSSTVNSLLLKISSRRCFKSNGLRSSNLSIASSTVEITIYHDCISRMKLLSMLE